MTLPTPPSTRRRLLGTLLGTLSTIQAACAAAPTSAKAPPMSDTPAGNGKTPMPPASTLAFNQATGALALHLSIAYADQADQDFAALMTALQRGLQSLARIELAHGQDPGLKTLAQQWLDRSAADLASVAAWQHQHPR